MQSICKICTNPITKKSPGIQCRGICELFCHLRCVDLNIEQYTILKATAGFVWKCADCRGGVDNLSQRPGVTRSKARMASVTDEDFEADNHEDLRRFMSEVKRDIRSINEKQEEMLRSLTFFSDKMSDFEQTLTMIAQNSKAIEQLGATNESLKSEMAGLKSKINEMDQFSRLKNIEIQGVPVKKDENLIQILNKISTSLGVELPAGKIDSIHRVQSFDKNAPKNIIVECNNRKLRDDLLLAVKEKRRAGASAGLRIEGIPTVIYINEHLTAQNKLLFRDTRLVAREKGYKYAWVKNGAVFIRKGEESPIKLIRNKECLGSL